MDLLITNARLVGKENTLADVGIEAGRIVTIQPSSLDGHEGVQTLDVAGRLVGPTFVDPHVHLDKAFTADRCPPIKSRLIDAVVPAVGEVAKTFTEEDVYERASKALTLCIQNGVTIVRTHVDIGPQVGLRGLRGMLEAKKRFAGLVDLQIAAFSQWGILRSPGTEELMEQAMREGADVVGGNTNSERTDADVLGQLEIIFRLAREFDADVDVHVDSTDDPTRTGLYALAVQTIKHGWHGRVTAGHCDALAAYDPYYAQRVIRTVKEAAMNIITMPLKMMFAGVLDQYPKRRGMTRIDDLLEAGVNVCLAQDNVQDPFQLVFGRYDPLETGMLVAYNYNWNRPEDMPYLYSMMTTNPAATLRLSDYGLEVGRPAHLCVMDAENWLEAIRTLAVRRWVLRSGKVVAETETRRSLFLDERARADAAAAR
jgi:cytosine/creatinine deaminase